MKKLFSGQCPIRGTLAVLAFMMLLPACASKQVFLDDTARAALRKQPAIHVVHYATPTPEVRPPTARRSYVKIKLHDAPNGVEIQSNLGNYDPALEVSNQFSRALTKSAGLGELSGWVAITTGEYGDMLKMGILDSTKVTRSALQNAASVAGLMITTEAMVAELPKDEAPSGGGGMGGMM